MSILAVVRKGSQGVIASDSLFVQGSTKVPPTHRANNKKIFKVGDAYVGFTGWTAMTGIFEHAADKYARSLNFSSRKDIFRTFLFLHEKLKKEYFVETKEDDDQPVESSQWDCLVLSPGGIFAVQSYREVMEYHHYWAGGSGFELAMGAMHAAHQIYDDPVKIAEAGVSAACEFNEACGQPTQVFQMEIGKNSKSGAKTAITKRNKALG